jgi:hypothetical protein
LLLMACLVVGCGDITRAPDQPDPHPSPTLVWDSAAASEVLAQQAELANDDPAIKASELLDGILNHGIECGMPADYVAKVRSGCQAIQSKPPVDLSADQVQSIRGIR